MTEDPNKKHNQQVNQSGRQTGQEQTGQQKDKGADDYAQKRPTQGGHDVETDEQDKQDKAGQRRAS